MSSAPFRIKGLDHLVLRVRDLDRMVQFYCDVLGCRLERTQAEIGLTQIRAGGSLIDLVTADGKLGRMGAPRRARKGAISIIFASPSKAMMKPGSAPI